MDNSHLSRLRMASLLPPEEDSPSRWVSEQIVRCAGLGFLATQITYSGHEGDTIYYFHGQFHANDYEEPLLCIAYGSGDHGKFALSVSAHLAFASYMTSGLARVYSEYPMIVT